MRAPHGRIELPPWLGDEPALIAFTVGELLQLDGVRLKGGQLEGGQLEGAIDGYDYHAVIFRPPPLTREEAVAKAKARWRAGNPEPLRALYPEISECFAEEPKRERGVRRPAHPFEIHYDKERTREVADTVWRIRQIWKKHFGKWKRPLDENPVNQIVATYLQCDGIELNAADVARIRKAMAR